MYGMPHNNQVGGRRPDGPTPFPGHRVLGGPASPRPTAGFWGTQVPFPKDSQRAPEEKAFLVLLLSSHEVLE